MMLNTIKVFLTVHGAVLLDRALLVGFILICLWAARWLLFRISDLALGIPWLKRHKQEHNIKRIRTVRSIIHNIISYVLFFIGAVQILKVIGGPGYDITPIIATLGVSGLAIGFGAQKLVRDAISGFFILLEDQYAVGDMATINDVSGAIEFVGIRITRIRDAQGRLVTIPNGDIAKVTNHSRGVLNSVIEVAFPASLEVSAIKDALQNIIQDYITDDCTKPPTVMGLAGMDSMKFIVRLEYYPLPHKQVQAELRLREYIRQKLISADIQIA